MSESIEKICEWFDVNPEDIPDVKVGARVVEEMREDAIASLVVSARAVLDSM